MGDWVKELPELARKSKIVADQAREEYFNNIDYYLNLKSKENEPCDLNGRDLYHGAGKD